VKILRSSACHSVVVDKVQAPLQAVIHGRMQFPVGSITVHQQKAAESRRESAGTKQISHLPIAFSCVRNSFRVLPQRMYFVHCIDLEMSNLRDDLR
jgi:hypothetical protein